MKKILWVNEGVSIVCVCVRTRVGMQTHSHTICCYYFGTTLDLDGKKNGDSTQLANDETDTSQPYSSICTNESDFVIWCKQSQLRMRVLLPELVISNIMGNKGKQLHEEPFTE